ncbi:hypothetical protein F4781DRAFT_308303 [Annulohypoxylon bovei var. microspora]|nr:hypothetical protein F4781DRAFT_308303 [Annulohypoxylon bovei var. microspora]
MAFELRRCVECSELTVKKIVHNGYLINSDVSKFVFNPTKEQESCDICSIIRHSLGRDLKKLRLYTDLYKVRLILYLFRNPPDISGSLFKKIDVIVMPSSQRRCDKLLCKELHWHYGTPDDKSCVARSTIPVHYDQDMPSWCPLASIVENRLLTQNVGLLKSAKMASKWLDNCLNFHGGQCAVNESSKLPTRVIWIRHENNSTQLELMESNGQRGKYVALSYCWGKTPFFKLTSANKASLMESILFPWKSYHRQLETQFTLRIC